MASLVGACGDTTTDGADSEQPEDSDTLATIAPLSADDAATGNGDDGSADPSEDENVTGETEANDDSEGDTEEVEASESESQPGDAAVSGSSDPQVAFAMNDLASRMQVPMSDITLVMREEMMWRDGSLGCPQPGMSYTQALVDGYKITLEAGGVTYAYHGQAGRDPFLCENTLAGEKNGGVVITLPPEVSEGGGELDGGSVDD